MMIAGYIKFFTRSVNSWLFGFSAFIAGSMKSLIVFSTQYSIGLLLTMLGYSEASLAIVAYLNSVSEVTFAAIIIHILVCTLFTWYYMNSSCDPVVRVKQYAKDQCQLENLQMQVSELKEKSALETKAKKEIVSKYDKEKAKSEKASKENKTLKEKVEENKKDKKKISDLEESIKERDNEIEIKACNLDKLQITLEASKEDVERSKSEFKELETKYMSSLKELDVKDCQISDLEDGEKELQLQMSDKNKEIKEKEQLVEELHEKITLLEKQLVDLESDLEEEKKLCHAIRMEKDLLEQTSANITEYMSTKKSEAATESEVDDEDSEKAVEKLQAERLAMLTDANKIKGELSETKSELASCKEELAEYVEKSAMLEGKYTDLEAQFDSLCEKTKKLKETIERKDIEIATITKFFSDRENELQTTTLKQSEEIQKLTKQLGLIGDDKRQITELNKQITDLKEEMASNEKNFKHQVSVLEEESHANYLKMRTSTRESEEHKREKEIYRKKLLENETKPLNQSNPSLSASMDMSDRSESPGSNKSMDEKAKDVHKYPPTSGTAVRPAMPPFHPMFRGMPPRFPPRPMGTPPFLPMPPRLPYTGPPRPFMPMMRNPPPNTPANNSRQATPSNVRYPTPNNMGHQIPSPAVGYQQTPPQNNSNVSGATPNGATSFNGQEYVNTLIDNLATKDNIRKDLFEKQNKSVL